MASTVFSALSSGLADGMPERDMLYTALTEHFPGGTVALLDSDLRILTMGGTELVHYGMIPEQMIGNRLENITTPEVFATVSPYYRRALQGETVRFITQYGGSQYMITATPMRESDGSVQSILIVAVNTSDAVEIATPQKAAGIDNRPSHSEEFFRLVLQATSDGIWEWDLTTDSISFSNRSGEIIGYAPDELPGTLAGWLDIVHIDDRWHLAAQLRNHRETGEEFHTIIRLYHRDGSLRWVLMRGFLLQDSNGGAVRMVGSHTDMTLLRLQEERHINSERRFRSLIQHSSDLTAIVDKSGRIIYQNPAFTHIFGYDGLDIADILHPDSITAFRTHFAAVLAAPGSPLPFEGWYTCLDGHEICLESVFTNLLNDSGVQGIVINSRDISERKRSERQMRNFNDLLVGIMESTGNSIYSLDRDLRYTTFNSNHKAAMERILGKGTDIGMSILDCLPEGEIIERLLSEFRGALLGERRRLELEYEFESRPVYNEVFINPIRTEAGEVSGIAVFINDATERELAEQQLSRAYDELDARVRERTADLQQALEQLNTAFSKEKELSELKTRFVSMVSHEFRTPLTSILSSTEILERYREKLSVEQQDRFYYVITESVRRMSDLLNDVVLLGRAESNNMPFNPVWLNPAQFCQKLVEELQADFLKDRTVRYSVEGSMREILVDTQLLRYILANLLSNAAKYSPEREPIALVVQASDSSVVFRVEDHGIGIAPEDIKHIYEPFFRSGQVETIPGTGLGLSIVRQSVARHGGTVEVETSDTDGTTFIVRLPA